MKIEVLKLIENALIGGRNGEMSYIYNNPLIFEIFNEWRSQTITPCISEREFFKSFLQECLNQDTIPNNQDNQNNISIGYKLLRKEYPIPQFDPDYEIYKEKETQINLLQEQKQKILSTLAHKLNPALALISSYEMKSKYGVKQLVFSFNVESVLKENEENEENEEKEENK